MNHPVGISGLRLRVEDMHRTPCLGSARRRVDAARGRRILLDEGSALSWNIVGRHDPENLSIETEDERALGLAQSNRVLGQGLEHWLQVEGGPPDHLEQLAGRLLLLQRDA